MHKFTAAAREQMALNKNKDTKKALRTGKSFFVYDAVAIETARKVFEGSR